MKKYLTILFTLFLLLGGLSNLGIAGENDPFDQVALLATITPAYTVGGVAPHNIDYYSESHQTTYWGLYSGYYAGAGQSFTGDGSNIATVKFNLTKVGTPPGTMVAKLYSHSGTWGSTGIGNTLLATSNTVTAITPPDYPTFALVTFTFASPYTTVNGTHYVVQIEYTDVGSDGSNKIRVGYDDVTLTHAGNMTTTNGGWTYYSAQDLCFYVISN